MKVVFAELSPVNFVFLVHEVVLDFLYFACCGAVAAVFSSSMASNEPSNIESSSDSEDDVDTSEKTKATSILDRLRPPAQSDLSRKRSIATNKRRGSCKPPALHKAPKSRGPAVRVLQFPNEMLSVRLGKLFCEACRHEVSTVKSTLRTHIKSQKHQDSKSEHGKKTLGKKQMLMDARNYIKHSNARGTTLPDEVVVYRMEVLKTFMSGGVAVNKIDHFRSLLQSTGEALTGRQHLADFIPLVRDKEQELVKDLISGKPISVIFDGTTTVCEAMAIVFRVVDEDFSIHQRLASLKLSAKSMTGEQVAHTLLSVLSICYQVKPHDVIAVMRDRASVNDCAVRSIRPLYTNLMDIGCFSHTLDHVGGRVKADDLKLFIEHWVGLFSHSCKLRLEWKDKTGKAIRTYSKTRWWSKWQVMEQVHDMFGDVVGFLVADAPQDSSILRKRLKATIEDLPARAQLQMQLSAVVEFGRPFADATYQLEGDGALCSRVYEVISALTRFVNAEPVHLPCTTAVARTLSAGNQLQQQQWLAFAQECIAPAIHYFNQRFGPGGALYDNVEAFRAAQYFDPLKVSELQPTVDEVADLARLPFLSNADVELMQEQLPQFLAACEGVRAAEPLKWWLDHGNQFPAWASAFKKVLLVQPSSAAVERVFSLLENSFGKNQASALEDYIEGALMLQYNHRSEATA